MFDEDIEDFIAALENNTRREILKRLILDDSYALEISRRVGVSQQAINKQLEMLEKANLIISMGMIQNSNGAPRKIYRPTGFSTLIIDYSQNFFEIKRRELIFDGEREAELLHTKKSGELLESLMSVNSEIDGILDRRSELLKKKDSIIGRLHERISDSMMTPLSKEILLSYLETLDVAKVAMKLSISEEIIAHVVNSFFA